MSFHLLSQLLKASLVVVAVALLCSVVWPSLRHLVVALVVVAVVSAPLWYGAVRRGGR